MNIFRNLKDLLIGIFGRKNSHFLFYFFAILLMTLASKSAYSDSLVAVVNTPVSIKYDDKNVDIISTQNTVEGAIRQSGIIFGEYDITEPPLDTLLTGKRTDIKVVRALPVLISDNNQEHIAYSAYSEPKEILQQLGIEYYPEDLVYSELIMDPAEYNSAGQLLIIKRAPSYVINVDDGQVIARSWASTVADLLKEKDIQLGKNDIVEPSLSSSLLNIFEITITRINYADIEEVEPISYTVANSYDFNMFRGQTRVIQEGVNGSKVVNYHIVYKNGVEISRKVTGSTVTNSPVTKKIAKGAIPTNDTYGWWPTIVSAANKYGVDAVKLYDVMMCESHGNQYSGTRYLGLFQYSNDTWNGASYLAGYGGKLITDGNAQIYVTAWKVVHDGGWSAWPYCGSKY